MTEKKLVTTRMFIQRMPDEPRMFEITFMNQFSWEPERLHLYIHEVELSKFADGLQSRLESLMKGERESVGAEGVYIDYGDR